MTLFFCSDNYRLDLKKNSATAEMLETTISLPLQSLVPSFCAFSYYLLICYASSEWIWLWLRAIGRNVVTFQQTPTGNLYNVFLRQPNIHHPGVPDPRVPGIFTEDSLALTLKPVFFDVQEYHKICECP
jgi:hypothetical protein